VVVERTTDQKVWGSTPYGCTTSSLCHLQCKSNNCKNMNIKKVTLFKRGSKYYAKTCFLGTVYTVSTGTSDKNDAWEIAPGRLTKKVQEQRTKGNSVRSAIEHYLDFNTESRDKTKRGVISFVKSYCKLLGYNLDTPAKQAFTKQSAIRFQQLRLADVEPEDRPRVARSTNTILRSVKCLYSERLLDTYDKIPDHVTSFKRVRSLKAPSVQYTVADKKEKIADAIRRCDALEDENYGAWLTYYLSLHAGLRRSEVAAAKWSWLTDSGILVQSDGDFQTKSGKSRLVPLSQSQIKRLREYQFDSEYIVPGPYTARYRVLPDEVARIIRDCGITGSKSFHELRKYYGANVATQLGIFHAQKYLGHHSPEITSKYYADVVEHKPVEIKILA